MSQEKQTAEEKLKSKGITPLTKHHDYDYLYCSVVDLLQEKDIYISRLQSEIKRSSDICFQAVNDYQKEVEEQAKEIEELTRSRDDVFHELEGYKEHNKQLQEEIERLKGENEFFKRMIRRKEQLSKNSDMDFGVGDLD